MVSNVTPVPRQIYLIGGRGAPSVALTSSCGTCHCRTYSYVCSCTAVLPLPGTPTTTEYKRRCRVTGWYTTGCPWLIPCLVTLVLQPLPAEPFSPTPFRLPHSAGLNPLSLSLLWFVPYRCSRDQDVLQNKRLYLHARPSEKPPSSGATLIDGECSPAFALVCFALLWNRIYFHRKSRY